MTTRKPEFCMNMAENPPLLPQCMLRDLLWSSSVDSAVFVTVYASRNLGKKFKEKMSYAIKQTNGSSWSWRHCLFSFFQIRHDLNQIAQLKWWRLVMQFLGVQDFFNVLIFCIYEFYMFSDMGYPFPFSDWWWGHNSYSFHLIHFYNTWLLS